MGPKGSTWLGFDTTGAEDLLIIKEARAFVMESSDGDDARQRLRREAGMLRRLEGSGCTPKYVDAWDEPRRSFLVYQHVEGVTLEHLISVLATSESRLPDTVLRDWVSDLCSAVATIHHRGVVLGDIKPANLIRTDRGFEFVDLELAGPPTTEALPGIGTTGYMSPQQGDPVCGRAFSDDIYALGATILTLALLVDASELPDGLTVVSSELAADPGNVVLASVVRCLDPEPARRFGTAEQLCRAATARRAKPQGAPAIGRQVDHLALARRIGDRLLSSAEATDGGAYWRSPHPVVLGLPGRDLYAGSAGTAAFLCQLFGATQDERYLNLAEAVGRWLWEEPPVYRRQVPMPGLYFGESGPGFLYLMLHATTGDALWRSRASAVGAAVARMPAHSPDLLTGDAGVTLFLTGLWQVTREAEVLDDLGTVISRLTADPLRRAMAWPIPPGHQELDGTSFVGLSHGAAGVGYCLAEYAATVPAPPTRKLAITVAERLMQLGRPCPQNPQGLVWPVSDQQASPTPTLWCHGAAGIIRMLASVERLAPSITLHDAIAGAALSVLVCSRWSGSTQCHGLAGNAEALLDAWRATGDDRWLRGAEELGRNLAVYCGEDHWLTELRDQFVPDLLIGEAGIGSALLRLADPSSPHVVSVDALRALAAPHDASCGQAPPSTRNQRAEGERVDAQHGRT